MLEKEYSQAPNAPKQNSNVEQFRPKNSEKQSIQLADHIPSFSEDSQEMMEKIRALKALVILEGNTVIKEVSSQSDALPRIKPTSYRDADDFGPLGGRPRSEAAAYIAARLGEETPQLVFAGGNPEKKRQSHGGVEHSGSKMYESSYLDSLKRIQASTISEHTPGARVEEIASTEPAPALILDTSENSYGDIMHAFELALSKGWTSIGFLTNQYHLPRVQALAELVQQNDAQLQDITPVFLGAEDVILSLSSGSIQSRYKALFMAAYAEDGMHKRILKEQEGMRAIVDGTYKPGESKGTAKTE